jgi:hypothetical protein
VLEKAVLPKLLFYVQNIWDMHSLKQSTHLQALYKEIGTLLKTEDSFREFSAAVVNQLQASVDVLPIIENERIFLLILDVCFLVGIFFFSEFFFCRFLLVFWRRFKLGWYFTCGFYGKIADRNLLEQ